MFHTRPASDLRTYRFDVGHRAHTGLKTVRQQRHRDWEILIEHCILGLTIRREQFNARIVETASQREEYLKGFSSRIAALRAARHRDRFHSGYPRSALTAAACETRAAR